MRTPIILVGIVEDNVEYARALSQALGQSPDVSVPGIWYDAESALAEIPAIRPDVVLMDVQLPGISGIECIRRLTAMTEGIEYLILSQGEQDQDIFEALEAGASGYLLKSEDCDTILRHIREIANGEPPVSRAIVGKLIRYFHRLGPSTPAVPILTSREEEIVALLAEGKMYKEVSTLLGIAMETTKKHIRNIYEKLHVQNRTEAVNKWRNSRSYPA